MTSNDRIGSRTNFGSGKSVHMKDSNRNQMSVIWNLKHYRCVEFFCTTAILMQWISFRCTQRLGSREWLLDRRLTAVTLNNWGGRHISEISFYSVREEAVCHYLMAWLLSVTTLPVGKLPPLGTHSVWCWSECRLFSMAFLFSMSFLSFTPALIRNHSPDRRNMNARTASVRTCPVIYHQCTWLCAGWQNRDISQCGEIAPKAPGNDYIWCYHTKVEKAVFQWCYLSCSVPTPCNDDLSLFSVLCSIFIYDQASFSLYFFGFITHFCAISATNEKIKNRNILFTVSNTFSIEWH